MKVGKWESEKVGGPRVAAGCPAPGTLVGARLSPDRMRGGERHRHADGSQPLRAPRVISPLTPALSPLRGEGDAMRLFGLAGSPGRERTLSIAAEPEQSGDAATAATTPRQPAPARRAPSPLNGERAGVRGENDQRARWFAERGRQASRHAALRQSRSLSFLAHAGSTAPPTFSLSHFPTFLASPLPPSP